MMLDKESAEHFAKMLIKRATGINIDKVTIDYQKVVNGMDTDLHGIRLDMSVTEELEEEQEESENKSWGEIIAHEKQKGKKENVRVFDIEPNKGSKSELPKRSRYLQALMDVKLLGSGEDYESMPELWTIWILPYDPFGQNRMIYFVKNVVEEFEEISYNDGVRKIFLYTGGTLGGNKNLKSLLNYINHSTAENAVDTELEKLHLGVEKLKQNKKIGVKYMRIQRTMRWYIQDEVKRQVEEQVQEELQNRVQEELQKQAEELQKQAEEEKKQAEQEKKQAEELQKQAEQEKKQMEEELRKREEELQKYHQLTSILLQKEKYDDLKRATEDEPYRMELYKKYEI
jgi:predicted transposase/invertase (TIGR01784 family)